MASGPCVAALLSRFPAGQCESCGKSTSADQHGTYAALLHVCQPRPTDVEALTALFTAHERATQ